MKNWLYNIGLGGLFLAIVITLAYFGLDAYTRHGDAILVPNVLKMKPFEAEEKLSSMDLGMKIIDTVYIDNMKPGVIVEQTPESNDDVKSGRVVYVTVNATSRPRVKMPKLTDCSLNLAKALLKNAGLVLGTVSKEYSEYGNNLVTAQRVGGRSIEAGEKVLKGTVVDITIIDSEISPNSDSTSVEDPADVTENSL
ncbi:MAG: PASTA domain-containing protein [Sphingomonadales bacterium]|nr:PASTA domain-containing protein [Sphingomonadales bacterium]